MGSLPRQSPGMAEYGLGVVVVNVVVADDDDDDDDDDVDALVAVEKWCNFCTAKTFETLLRLLLGFANAADDR